MSEAKAGKNNPMFGRIGENNPTSKKIYAYDKDNITTLSYEFSSYTEAGLRPACPAPHQRGIYKISRAPPLHYFSSK
jgi:hypothetical protein